MYPWLCSRVARHWTQVLHWSHSWLPWWWWGNLVYSPQTPAVGSHWYRSPVTQHKCYLMDVYLQIWNVISTYYVSLLINPMINHLLESSLRLLESSLWCYQVVNHWTWRSNRIVRIQNTLLIWSPGTPIVEVVIEGFSVTMVTKSNINRGLKGVI